MTDILTSALPQYNFDPGFVNGLGLARPSNTTLTVAAGNCTDSSNTQRITISSPITINTAVMGLNGIDTGTIANNTGYYVYVVADGTGFNQPGAVISLNSVQPTMPAGQYPTNYSLWRRIGFVITASGSSNLVNFAQYGNSNKRDYYFDGIMSTPLSAGTSATFASVAVSLMSVYAAKAISNAVFVATAANQSVGFRPTGFSFSSSTNYNFSSAASATEAFLVNIPLGLNVSGVSSFDYYQGGTNVTINVYGFEDYI